MSSQAVAVMSRKWAMRMGLVTLAFSAFAVWCIYDANVTYPRFNRRAQAYNELVRQGRQEDWAQLAEQKGWKEAFDPTDKNADGTVILKGSWDIGSQYVMMAMCVLVGLFTGVRILLARHKTMRADDNGFLTIEGERIPYEAIERLDMKRWQKKSIVTVHHRENGIPRKTRIDDWIYEGGEDVLHEIQRRTGIGTPPEKDEEPASDDESAEASASEEPSRASAEQPTGG